MHVCVQRLGQYKCPEAVPSLSYTQTNAQCIGVEMIQERDLCSSGNEHLSLLHQEIWNTSNMKFLCLKIASADLAEDFLSFFISFVML